MRILNLDLPQTGNGLSDIKMSGMSDLVLLAGSNGAGKSRLLNAINVAAQRVVGSGEIEELNHRLFEISMQLDGMAVQVSNLKNSYEKNDVRTIARIERAAEVINNEKNQIIEKINWSSRLVTSMPHVAPVVVYYGTYLPIISDWKQQGISDTKSQADEVLRGLGLSKVSHGGLYAIKRLIDKAAFSRQGDMSDAEQHRLNLEKFREIVRDLLETDLTWDAEGEPMVFGRPVSEAGLSPGQWVLLQIAISLFFQDGNKDELILLWDEPENHLHPRALISVVEKVRKKCPDAQIWIATHSLNLLAHFDASNIWFVKDGKVEYAGPKTLDVINSLLGDESGIEEIFSFLALPAKAASNSFAVQCLLPPPVIDTPPGDPQTMQIIDCMGTRNGVKIRILDWGMGKGRLLGEMESLAKACGGDVRDSFDYFGYDPFCKDGDKSLCLSRLSANFENPYNRYFENEKNLLSGLNDASFDFVVMCNVLHEIPPEEWTRIFGKNGIITKLLKESGHLLVVEDQLLPVGERAHRFGYLVMDSHELRLLTGMSKEDPSVVSKSSPDPRYSHRLKAHKIPARILRNVTSASRRAAVEGLCKRSLLEIKEMQSSTPSSRTGRQYAFWVHQHVNATLALEQL